MPIDIRDESEADQDSIREVHRSAFGGVAEARLVDELRQFGAGVISLVAEREGRIAGHVLFSAIAAPVRALALAPVAVIPECQNSGIGSALIREGLRRAEIGEWAAVFVLGDSAPITRASSSASMRRRIVNVPMRAITSWRSRCVTRASCAAAD